ncbi:MAG: GNAT family N-acetyltransferase [Gammaproteobacteria bacterium]|nr:GNAT family N-acetyltransferase [Gammaproteobacteria bacterium]MDH3536043.1 GNAT family N-acetyltransferase [Gammaproteobacteria bacterium]
MTSTDYQIRPAVAADRPRWDPLWQGYLRFYEASLSDEFSDLLWQRIIDPAHEIQARLAATRDGSLVGLVHFLPHAHTWYADPVCYLNDLFVLPEIRGGGIGKRLIDAVVDEAKRQHWSEVYWHTQHHNTVARGLYDKVTGGTDGFVNYCINVVGLENSEQA